MEPIKHDIDIEEFRRANLLLIGCGILKKEIEFIIEKNRWPLQTKFLDSSLHVNFEKLNKSLKTALNDFSDRNTIVFYGTCHPLISNILAESDSIRTPGQNCVEILTGKEVFESELQKGAFFLLEDWARRWNYITNKTFESNKEAMISIFQEDRKYFLAIRTPCSADFKNEAKEISSLISLPLKWLDVSLDILEKILADTIKEKLKKKDDAIKISEKSYSLLKMQFNSLIKEKADLQIVNALLKKITSSSGLQNTVKTILKTIMETIGGLNIVIYYCLDGTWYSLDIFDNEYKGIINDPLILKVLVERKFLEEKGADSFMTNSVAKTLNKGCNWVFPLIAGDEMIGVLKIEGVLIKSTENVISSLQGLMNYISYVIKNELINVNNIKIAYDKVKTINKVLKREIVERRSLEKELASKVLELEETNRKLKKLDQAKSAFISTVSHELRTPLTITKEGLLLVLEKVIGPINIKQENLLKIVVKSVDRLGRMINDLLDLSKIESGKLVLKCEFIDIVSLINDVVLEFEIDANIKGLELVKSFSAEKIDAYGDADKLVQVFTNLISNAMKFTMKGQIEISVKEKEKDIECLVSDTGIGIDEADIGKIFNMFEQVGQFSGLGGKGTGLGLSISKELIVMHKGSITVESEPNKGSIFKILLPKGQS